MEILKIGIIFSCSFLVFFSKFQIPSWNSKYVLCILAMSISDKIRLWSINAWHTPDKEDKVRRLRMRYVWLKEWVIQCNFTAQNLNPFPISAVVVGSQTFSYWRLRRRMNGLLNLGTNFTSLNLSGRHLSSTLSDHPGLGYLAYSLHTGQIKTTIYYFIALRFVSQYPFSANNQYFSPRRKCYLLHVIKWNE